MHKIGNGGGGLVIRLRKSAIISLFAVAAAALISFFALSQKAEKSSAQKSIALPIIMYHQITRNEANAGKYIITEKELEKDLIYLRDNGYETVNTADLIAFVEGKRSLPEKCVMITVDDGYETGYTILYPLLCKYNMKAVLSVVGSLTQLYTDNGDHNDKYSYLDKEEVRLLANTPQVEIQNHSYDMHYCKSGMRKGINKLYGESYEAYEKALYDDVGKMQEYLFGITGRLPEAMAYPFGEYCADTAEICRKLGFSVTFTCEEKINTVTAYRKDSLYNLGRYNRSGLYRSEDFFEKLIV